MMLKISLSEMEAAFTEWDRRYREDPKAFHSDVERFLAGQTVEEYGQSAAQTFLMFLGKAQKKSG